MAIDKSVTIQGLDAEEIVIDGGGSDNNTRVFNNATYATLTGVSVEEITADDFLASNLIAEDRSAIAAM